MKFNFDFGFSALTRFISDSISNVRKALTTSVNVIGRGVVQAFSNRMSDATGTSPSDIEDDLDITEASEGDEPTFEMDATKVVPPPTEWARPWEARSDKDFKADLVAVVTQHDEKVCPKCKSVEANGPYTAEEIAKIQTANPYGNGLVHVNCRCIKQSWSSFNRRPVRFAAAEERQGGFDPQSLFEGAAQKIEESFRRIFRK